MTDHVTPPPCDAEIFKRGEAVMLFHGPRSGLIEEWVKKLAAETQTHTDWHFAGGRAVVLVLGGEAERGKVRAAAVRLWPELLGAHRASGRDWVTRKEIQLNLMRTWL